MHTFRRSILSSGILALTSAAAWAQTWDGGGDGLNWAGAANWSPDTALVSGSPNLSLYIVSGGALTTNQNFAGTFVLQQLAFSSPGPYTINGNPIRFDNLGAAPSLATFGGGPSVTFNVPVTFNASTLSNVSSVNFAAGATIAAATTLSLQGTFTGGTIVNNGVIAPDFASVSADISGPGSLIVASQLYSLTGTNSYSGGSTLQPGAQIYSGDTNGVQGSWSLGANSQLGFAQAFAGTMSGVVSGPGNVAVASTGKVTLGVANSYSGVTIVDTAAHLGIGHNLALGTSTLALVQANIFNSSKVSAEGGARVVANPIVFYAGGEFTGTNNLTFTDASAKSVGSNGAVLRHTSTATTTVSGTFTSGVSTTIDVQSGTLVLGAPVNNGFRMDGTTDIAAGATLQMISNNPVRLGVTNLNGGTIVAANGVAVPTGLALTGSGAIAGRVAAEAGSLIEATGTLTMGDSTHLAGYFSNGELRVKNQTVTLADKNQATLGSITELGVGASPGTLNAANGVFLDFSRGLTGYGTVNSVNTLAKATIINGSVIGASGAQPLDFTGYVKGLGDFTNVIFSGTFSPGLSPAIVPVENGGLGGAGTLLMEIGGLIPGAQFDQLAIAGVFNLDGILDVDLLNGFAPSLGDSFLLFDGATSGAFDAFALPALASGLAWDTTTIYSGGTLTVVPEPSAAMLLLGALTGLLARRARR